MASRTKARKRAADILFESEARGVDPLVLLQDRVIEPHAEASVPQYTVDLVEGVVAHRERIDELLETYSRGWTIARMPAVDRALLRVGTVELIFNDDIPDAVAVDEAVDLVDELSPGDSPAFVNGILGRLLEIKPTLRA